MLTGIISDHVNRLNSACSDLLMAMSTTCFNITLVATVGGLQFLHVYFIGYVLADCKTECSDVHKYGVVITGFLAFVFTLIYMYANDKFIIVYIVDCIIRFIQSTHGMVRLNNRPMCCWIIMVAVFGINVILTIAQNAGRYDFMLREANTSTVYVPGESPTSSPLPSSSLNDSLPV